eukprot:SAG31_NODE_2066_length_6527_cov_6.499378_1_plen_359_part_00
MRRSLLDASDAADATDDDILEVTVRTADEVIRDRSATGVESVTGFNIWGGGRGGGGGIDIGSAMLTMFLQKLTTCCPLAHHIALLFRQRIELATQGFNPDQTSGRCPAAPASNASVALQAIDLTAEVDAPDSTTISTSGARKPPPTFKDAISFLQEVKQRVPARTYSNFIGILSAYSRHGDAARIRTELHSLLGSDSELYDQLRNFLPNRGRLEPARTKETAPPNSSSIAPEQRSSAVTIDLARSAESSTTNKRQRGASEATPNQGTRNTKRDAQRASTSSHASSQTSRSETRTKTAEDFVPGTVVEVKWTDGKWYAGSVKRVTTAGNVRIVYAETDEWHECEETVKKTELVQRLRIK